MRGTSTSPSAGRLAEGSGGAVRITRLGISPKDPDSSEEAADSEPFGKELRGLRHDAPLLRELGVNAKTARAYGVGMAFRGLMKSLLACPVYIKGTETIAAYVGRRPRPKADQHLWKLVVQSPLSAPRLAESGLLNAVALMDAEVSSVQSDLLTDRAFNPAGTPNLMLYADEWLAARGQDIRVQGGRLSCAGVPSDSSPLQVLERFSVLVLGE